jgi:two-component system, OmpR family, sensor histidine kinase CiaH
VKLPHPPGLGRLRRLPGGVGRLRTPGDRGDSAAVVVSTPDDDSRLLRRTRLRLMAVSGAVTLVILVVLGAAVYEIVAAAVEGGAADQLKRASGVQPGADEAYGLSFEGEAAGLIPMLIDPAGLVHPPRGFTGVLPAGLPNKSSLAAVTKPGDLDIREVVSTSGTPYRVLSFAASSDFGDYKVQWAQDRSGEVHFLNTLAEVILGGSLIALLAAVAAGYLYAGRALVPIRLSIDRRQAALQRQREFTANASHELRTPLTVIRTSIEDLRRNRRSRVEDVGEALDDIEAEVRTVTALVDDMLLLARTDSGAVQLDRTPLDLADTTVEAASLLISLGTERGVAILVEPLPSPISGDGTRLRQLVTILVDNAIRHSSAGSTVEVRVRPEPGAAVLEVVDHGPGIKPENLPRLWERFWRADDAPVGGTGLGLAIAKWIVEQHGGTIGAENVEGGGARFWVRLPERGPAGPGTASLSAVSFGAVSLDADDQDEAGPIDPGTDSPAPGSPRWTPRDSSDRAS